MLGTPEYAAEFLGTSILVLVGLSAVTFDFARGAPGPSLVADESVRRLLTGMIFAGTAAAVVYSPLGRRSGGHLNPAVTLAFFRLDKITRRSAATYVAVQIAGAVTGAALVRLLWGRLALSVHVGVTAPGHGGALAAFPLEVVMTFVLVSLILNFVDRPRLMPFTPIAASGLVAFFVLVAAPISGTSLNPARSVGPALVSGDYSWLWIYLIAPPLGAFIASVVFARARGRPKCGKLWHAKTQPCNFLDCKYSPPRERVTTDEAREGAA
jgi:aquaporin Z